MNRRDFTKICASAALTGVVMDRTSSGGPMGTTSEEPANAYVRREGMTWIFGSEKSEKTVALRGGKLLLTSYRNKLSGYEYQDHNPCSDEIRLSVDGVEVSSPMWHWTFVSERNQRLAQGELQLDICLKGGPLEVTKHWVIYPQTAIIREWLTIENISNKEVRLQNIYFLNTKVTGGQIEQLELDYISGGGNFNGSQLLKTERLSPAYSRTFDSNLGIQKGNYSAYLPLILLRDSKSSDSMAVGWDYMGHWKLQVGWPTGEQVGVAIQIAGYDDHLKAGSQLQTPKAFTAAFSGDRDQVGNQILDWQYRYLWEYTNPDYFGKTRWAVDWPGPWVGDGGVPSADNWGRRLSLDLRYVDLLRESGGDILWDDAGWYDRWGSWNHPDWQLTTSYLRKHDMRWALWYPTFLATPESTIAQKHPEWVLSGRMTLEQSIGATEDWQKKLLEDAVTQWGDFQWRYDIAPAAGASDTQLLAADHNFRNLLQHFKTTHPKSGIDACDDGGRWISYDLARFADSGEYTDGGVGPYSGYYTSLLVPPDKLHNVSDFDHTFYNPSSDRIHLALDPTWYRDPGDGNDIESIRKDWELYKYLIARGVAGRWSHIFRPQVTNDDPIWYVQRMDAAGRSGVIITKHAKTGSDYLLVSTPLSNFSGDQYEGGPTRMTQVLTTKAAAPDTGIYADPIDNDYRYYGVPGEIYGPVNFRYQDHTGEQSYVTHIVKHGAPRQVDTTFFGMSFQIGATPITISEFGQYDPGGNRGMYSLMLVRASDRVVLGSATLDMSQGSVDALGFKYAKLDKPILLQPGLSQPIVVFPRGLQPDAMYDVQTYHSKVRSLQSGTDLMATGIALPSVPAGELIVLNLPHYPGSGTDKLPPRPPSQVTKRRGTNLGVQGIEIAWSPGHDNNWISYYEILRNGSVVARAAKGNFFFDHTANARHQIDATYEVRTIDGDGNRSPAISARSIAGDPESHQPLGEFSRTQGQNGWKYEQTFSDNEYQELCWKSSGYEGYWSGSGLGRIGRIWMEPSAAAEIARTFIAAHNGTVDLLGKLQKDPSADVDFSVFVRIDRGVEQVWPPSGWAMVPEFKSPITYQINRLTVREGDQFRFIIKRIDGNRSQPIIWNPIIVVRQVN